MKLEKTTEFVIVSGWVLMMLLCFGVMLADIYLSVVGLPNAALADLAKVTLGFVVGSLPPLVVGLLKSTPAPALKPP